MLQEPTRSFASETAPQAGNTRLRLSVVERPAPPFRPARAVVGLHRVFRESKRLAPHRFLRERTNRLRSRCTIRASQGAAACRAVAAVWPAVRPSPSLVLLTSASAPAPGDSDPAAGGYGP